MYSPYNPPLYPRTPLATLAICASRYSMDYELQDGDGYVQVTVPLGSIDQRPGPIQRAWSRLEAKWGMAALEQGGSPAPPRPLSASVDPRPPQTPGASSENGSQVRA